MKKTINFFIIFLIAFLLLFSNNSFAKNSEIDFNTSIKDTYSGLKIIFDFVFGDSYISFNQNTPEEEIKINDHIVLTFIILLIIYWLFLLVKFEK